MPAHAHAQRPRLCRAGHGPRGDLRAQPRPGAGGHRPAQSHFAQAARPMRILFALAAVLISSAAMAAPRIDSVSVKVVAGKGNDVVISVSIERPTLLDLNCDAMIDPGDGGRIPISWNIGDSRTKTARYDYKRPGSYRVKVAGSGKDACVGVKEATISVGTP